MALDFGSISCGSEASREIEVSNTVDGSPLTWSATTDAPFAIDGVASGTLMPFESAALTVRVTMTTTASPRQLVVGHVHVATNDPRTPVLDVQLAAQSAGAQLVATPTELDFGDIPLHAASPPLAWTVRNAGDQPAVVSVVSPPNQDFSIAPQTNQVTLQPNDTISGTASFHAEQFASEADVLAFATAGSVCGQNPSVALTGRGVKGVALISPGTLDFGLVDCQATAAQQTFTVQNTGDAPMHVTATVTQGVLYHVSPAQSDLAPGDSVVMHVGSDAIPWDAPTAADYFDGAITIATDAPDDVPHVVKLLQTAHGAKLTFLGTSPVAFGRAQVGAHPTKGLLFQNDGNADATVAMPDVVFPITKTTIPAGTTGTVDVTFLTEAPYIGNESSQTFVVTVTPSCGAAPSVTVTGTAFDRATLLTAAASSNCASAVSGRVYCWGDWGYDQLGMTYASGLLTIVPNVSNAQALGSFSAGHGAITSTNDVVDWGKNHTPQSEGFTDAIGLGGDWGATCAVRSGGTVWCWGGGGYLGDGTTNGSAAPVQASGLTNAVALATGYGYTHTCAVSNGQVACWGVQSHGEIGNGSLFGWAYSPAIVPGLSNVAQVATGSETTCARRNDGTVACWGQLFGGDSVTPVDVSGVSNVARVAVGGPHECVLDSSGNVACWGSNANGELGNGTKTNSSTPVSVSLPTSAIDVIAGWDDSCALLTSGQIMCWGGDAGYDLGGPNASTVPIYVVGFD